MDLDFGVFARVDDHAVHVCRVAEDAPAQQNILRVEADFGAVLVRASCDQTWGVCLCALTHPRFPETHSDFFLVQL